ncbi:hypothetical protein M2389_002855 [Microbacterium phyllosphaerae]|nr:hypothetical protein [Microbacterium phyllosphaerae]
MKEEEKRKNGKRRGEKRRHGRGDERRGEKRRHGRGR